MTQAWLDDETLAAVRPQVRELLESSQGFRALAPEQQRDMARKQELTPGRALLARQPQARPLARAQDAAVDAAGRKASEKIGTFAGADFQGATPSRFDASHLRGRLEKLRLQGYGRPAPGAAVSGGEIGADVERLSDRLSAHVERERARGGPAPAASGGGKPAAHGHLRGRALDGGAG